MQEFLTNVLIQTACAAVGFVAGMLYMRDNYIQYIHKLKQENQQLKDGMYQ